MRKRLIFIGGTVGVGKSACAAELKKLLPKCAFLEGDACGELSRVKKSRELDRLVLDNIACLLRNFLSSPELENVVLVRSLGERDSVRRILSRIGGGEYDLYHITLVASHEAVTARLTWDVRRGSRRASQIAQAIDQMRTYDVSDSITISTDNLTPREVAARVFAVISQARTYGHVYEYLDREEKITSDA